MSSVLVAFLINASWQVALVALAAAGCARMLRGGRARDEHRLWVAALIVAVVLPVMSTMRWPSLGGAPPSSAAPNVSVRAVSAAEGGGAPLSFAVPRPRIEEPAPNLALWLASLYLVFLALRAFVLWRGWSGTRRVLVNATRETAGAVRAAASRCRESFGLREVAVLRSHGTDAPVTIGSSIVLPTDIAEKLSEEALLSVVGHEMAHVRRHDFAINIAYEILYALIAFHPAAALIRRRLSQTREHACDEMVAATLVKPVRYAHALLDVAAMLAPPAKPTWSLAMVDRGFEERVLRLARPRRAGTYARVMAVAAFVLLASTVAIGTAFAVERRQVWSAATPVAALKRPLESGDYGRRTPDICWPDASAIPSLIAQLADETPNTQEPCYTTGTWNPAIDVFVSRTAGEAAAIALASIGEPSIAPLIPQLDSPSATVRRNAAWAIGEIRGGHGTDRSAAVEPLLRLTSDSDPTVRRAAAFTFGELRSDEAIEPLITLLSDPVDAVRATAAYALGEIRARSAVEMLERVEANDPSAETRKMARYALNEIAGH